jgi:hypothetical protein
MIDVYEATDSGGLVKHYVCMTLGPTDYILKDIDKAT